MKLCTSDGEIELIVLNARACLLGVYGSYPWVVAYNFTSFDIRLTVAVLRDLCMWNA